MQLLALFRLALASAPHLKCLTSLHNVTRRPVLQKVQHHTISSALSACKHMVSGSFSLPSRGSFHLSLTVLYSIGHMVVFSLMGWSPLVPSGFLVSRRTPDFVYSFRFLTTGLLPSLAQLSICLRLTYFFWWLILYPYRISTLGLGCSDFARHYSRNRFFSFFSSGYLDVSVPRVPPT